MASNKDKVLELVENGYDKDEMIQSMVNWLGDFESGEFLENYLGVDLDED
jgi:hypothetical protein